jgi:hypothetical protein
LGGQLETRSHSFVIKVWLEETNRETGQVIWRGHVTHVATRERRYIQTLDAIPAIIAPYLKQMGVKFPLSWRVRQWLKR